ncbi:MAG: hypothetical protein RJB38_1051 [Pseudomonadota bacterium]|jgi:hypothetical protein
MIHLMAVVSHYYPVVAIPVALASIQLAVHFKRQKRHSPMFFFLIFSVTMLVTAGGWIYSRL